MINFDDCEDVDLVVKIKLCIQCLLFYKVLLLNDDFMLMEFVVYVFECLFKMIYVQVIEIMLMVYCKGVVVVGVFLYEIVEMKVVQVMEFVCCQQYLL